MCLDDPAFRCLMHPEKLSHLGAHRAEPRAYPSCLAL